MKKTLSISRILSLGLVTTFTSTNGKYFQTSIICIIKKINELEPFYVVTTYVVTTID